MTRVASCRNVVFFGFLATACGTSTPAVDAGADASPPDGSGFVLDAGTCDVSLVPATLPGPPANCASCPPSAPGSADLCDAGGLTCQYGGDPRLGCNPIYQCLNGAWQLFDFRNSGALCGPVFEPDGLDAGCLDAAPLVLRDGGVCSPSPGNICDPFLSVAPGCSCGSGDSAHLGLCGGGSFDLVCSDAGRLDGVYVSGLCGE